MDDDGVTLVLAQEGAADGRLVGDLAGPGAGLCGADDGEDFLAVASVNLDGAADLDVIGAVRFVDDRGVLDQGLETLDLPSTKACSFLASSYSAFSARSPCSLASWIR